MIKVKRFFGFLPFWWNSLKQDTRYNTIIFLTLAVFIGVVTFLIVHYGPLGILISLVGVVGVILLIGLYALLGGLFRSLRAGWKAYQAAYEREQQAVVDRLAGRR